VKVARQAGSDRVVLFIHGGKGWDIASLTAAPKPVESVPASKEAEPIQFPPPVPLPILVDDDKLLGIPRELVLPASIGLLAVVIIGIFTISRLSD